MNQICTGNLEQLWEYHDPDENGQDFHVVKSEKEIIDEYFKWWSDEMTRLGKSKCITETNCVDDWIIVHWARMVKMED